MNPVQVRHVREALDRRFASLIDVSDLDGRPEAEVTQARRTRALAALAVQIETGMTDEEAALTVIDGRDDMGIDAVAVSSDGAAPRLWLIQSKWHERGTAGIKQDEALKFARGLNKILNAEYNQLNARFQVIADDVDRVLGNPRVQVSLVVALLGATEIHVDVAAIFNEECDRLNYAKSMLEYHVLGLKDFHRSILGDGAEPKIDIEIRLDGWNLHREPYEAYYGTVSIADVANWYDEHGRGLFSKNIRDSLNLTDVNTGIVRTLVDSPQDFWYFNNGITVLCDTVDKTPRFASAPGGRGDFHVVGASVVNGAQTVAAAHRAVRQNSDTASTGQVLVRLISLESCPEDFGKEVTEKTNTQNQVETRDFATLDPEQHRLREDFALALGKTYVIKRGDNDPPADSGCTIVEAITALACCSTNAEFSAKAKRDLDLLWDRPTYRMIFGKHPEALTVWRSVLLVRQVRSVLADLSANLQGRASAVATYGDLLISHVVFNLLGGEGASKDEPDWSGNESKVTEFAELALDWLIYAIDAEFGRSSHVMAACKSSERSQTVVYRVLEGIRSGESVPELPRGYKSTTTETGGRRANAVAIIVEANEIPNGTALEFRPATKPERTALAPWLAADPQRSKATWVNDRNDQLEWAADGQRYSTSNLVMTMIEQASGKRPKAVQGTSRWYVPGRGSLVDIAESIRSGENEAEN